MTDSPPPIQPTSATPSSSRKASLIAFFAWAAYLPLLTWRIATANPSGGAAYAMAAALPILFGGALVLGVIVASIIGACTKTVRASLFGLLWGLPLSVFVYGAIGDMEQSKQQAISEQETREIAALARLVVPGDPGPLRAALAKPSFKAELVCELGSVPSEEYRRLLSPRALSAVDMLLFAELATEKDISIGQKQAIMFGALAALADRNVDGDVRPLIDWLALWRKAVLGGAETRIIDMVEGGLGYGSGCPWTSEKGLVEQVFRGWKDGGITAWLDAGFTFTPLQFRVVRQTIQSAEILERAAESGVDVHAPVPVSPLHEALRPVLVEGASFWSWKLDHVDRPEEFVKLAAVLVKLEKGEARKEACDVFLRGERARIDALAAKDDPNVPFHGFKADTPERLRSGAALRLVLCPTNPQGK